MKLTSLLLFSIVIGFGLTASVLYHSGSPGHKTGSPGDGSNCTQCHTGTAVTGSQWIESDIPETGYVPGSVYTIQVKGSHAGAQRYGFEITSEDATNAKKGSFQVSDATRNQLVDLQGSAITHTDNGISPVNDSASWSFNWTAPEAGTGAISFYAAVNSANGNGNTSGDVIYLSNVSFEEDIPEFTPSLQEAGFLAYPNPASDILTLDYSSRFKAFSLHNANGKIVLSEKLDVNGHTQLNLSDYPAGIYYIQFTGNEIKQTQRLVIL